MQLRQAHLVGCEAGEVEQLGVVQSAKDLHLAGDGGKSIPSRSEGIRHVGDRARIRPSLGTAASVRTAASIRTAAGVRTALRVCAVASVRTGARVSTGASVRTGGTVDG